MWDHEVAAPCRDKEFGHWLTYSRGKEAGLAPSDSWCKFCMGYSETQRFCFASPPASNKGLPHTVPPWIQGLYHKASLRIIDEAVFEKNKAARKVLCVFHEKIVPSRNILS